MLDARIISEGQYDRLENDHIRSFYKRVPFVYAHGKLEDDFGTDIFYLFLGEYHLNDRLIAYTDEGKPVCFHLYKHPRTFEKVGIVTYSCDDKEAYQYGRKLVQSKPDRF